jgi:hypothetical protein
VSGHRVLAGTISAERLTHEQRQRGQRRVEAIAIGPGELLHCVLQLARRKHIAQSITGTLGKLLAHSPDLIK